MTSLAELQPGYTPGLVGRVGQPRAPLMTLKRFISGSWMPDPATYHCEGEILHSSAYWEEVDSMGLFCAEHLVQWDKPVHSLLEDGLGESVAASPWTWGDHNPRAVLLFTANEDAADEFEWMTVEAEDIDPTIALRFMAERCMEQDVLNAADFYWNQLICPIIRAALWRKEVRSWVHRSPPRRSASWEPPSSPTRFSLRRTTQNHTEAL